MNRFTIALAAFAIAGPAWAAMTPQEEASLQQNCSGDYMRLCGQYDPGSPQVEQCFKTNMSQLTPQCRTAINAYSKANPGGRK